MGYARGVPKAGSCTKCRKVYPNGRAYKLLLEQVDVCITCWMKPLLDQPVHVHVA